MEPADALIGTTLADRYRIDALLGEGTMCHVYLGEHLVLRNKLAIKILDPLASRNEEAARRFEREALAAANLAHPGIARALDFGRAPDGRLFIIMEFIEGRPLDVVIAKEGALEPWRATNIATQMLSALAYAHSKGIVHRDLKPGNVVLVDTPDRGGSDLVKILDFGVAKVTTPELIGGTELTQEGLVYGTPGYLSPEQALGRKVDHRADLYSVGVVLYEMLVGRPPFVAAEEVRLLIMHVDQPPTPPSQIRAVPAGLEEVVLQLLAKSPDDRYPDAQSVIEALDAAEAESVPGVVVVEPSEMDMGTLAQAALEPVEVVAIEPEPSAPPPPPRPPPPAPRAPSRSGAVATAVVVTILLGGLAAYLFWERSRERARAPRDDEARAEEILEPITAAPATAPRTIEELEALVTQYPRDPALRREIAALQVKRRNLKAAVPAYREALRLDASLGSDPLVQRHLVDALGSPYVWRDAAELLGQIGAPAAEALERGAVEEGRTRVRDRSRKVLEDSHATLPPWVEAAFAVDDATTCEERTAAIARATGLADRRLLGPLRRRQRTPPRSDRDCDREELATAIRTLADLPR